MRPAAGAARPAEPLMRAGAGAAWPAEPLMRAGAGAAWPAEPLYKTLPAGLRSLPGKGLHCLRRASIIRHTMRTRLTIGALFLCSAVAGAAGAARAARPETFVIHAGLSGRAATIKIPVGSVSAFSANGAEALNYGDSGVEAMRLRGNVRIDVLGPARSGVTQPIHIRADNVVLELTADETPRRFSLFRPVRSLRSTEIIVDADDTQTFVGNVSFTVPTSAGSMQITADRVEHSAGAAAGS